MKKNQIVLANKIYLILAGLFITSLVASNLIFTKNIFIGILLILIYME